MRFRCLAGPQVTFFGPWASAGLGAFPSTRGDRATLRRSTPDVLGVARLAISQYSAAMDRQNLRAATSTGMTMENVISIIEITTTWPVGSEVGR